MRFLLDQSAEARLGVFLQTQGHDVTRVARDYPAELPDDQVLAIAYAEQRVLLTNDRDFGELVFRQGQPHAGVIYFRLPLDMTAAHKIDWLRRLLTSHQADLGKFIGVEPSGIRVS